MERGEQIHVISAGEGIHTAYSASFRELPYITRTIVFAESANYESSPDPAKEKSRLAVRNAVSAVQQIAATLSIPFSREMVFPPVYPSVLASLAKISRDHPGARFTFDLSGGRKELCMALQATAPWVGAEVWCAFDGKGPAPVPVPDRNIRQMMGNVNYQTILALLLRRPGRADLPDEPAWWSREYLFVQLSSQYVPTRSTRVKTLPGDTWTIHDPSGKDKKTVPELTQATFSGFMAALRDAGLIEEAFAPENRKEKRYRVTGHGEIAFRFFSYPAPGTLVKIVLEST